MPIVTRSDTSMLLLLFSPLLVSLHISLSTRVSVKPHVGLFEYLLTKYVARNGVQPTAQLEWGHWCNLKGAGFGVRPTTNTGDVLADAFVWVKPGGEGDVSYQCQI